MAPPSQPGRDRPTGAEPFDVRMLRWVVLVVTLVSATWVASEGAADDCETTYVVALGMACMVDGLYVVELADGIRLETHGPDPRTPAFADHGRAIDANDPRRAPVCASTDNQRVLYGRPAD